MNAGERIPVCRVINGKIVQVGSGRFLEENSDDFPNPAASEEANDTIRASDPQYDRGHAYRIFACSHCGHRLPVPLSCGNRFCEVCQSSRHYRAYNRLKKLAELAPRERGTRLKFITLTLKNSPTIEEGVIKIRQAFKKLRSSVWWKSKVSGGVFVIEAKRGKSGWHVHAHIACHSGFMKQKELSYRWEKLTGAYVVWIVNAKVSVAGYLAKYMTKSPPSSLDDQHLISSGLKGVRLFQPFGDWFNVEVIIPRHHHPCPSCQLSLWTWTDATFWPTDELPTVTDSSPP